MKTNKGFQRFYCIKHGKFFIKFNNTTECPYCGQTVGIVLSDKKKH